MAQDQITFIIADLGEHIEQELIALALDIDAELKEKPPLGTPRDTGWAAANWIPSVGRPIVDVPKVSERAAKIGQLAAAAGKHSAGLGELLNYSLDGGQKIYISNGVPYIVPLNEGSSRQAPSGFVQFAVYRAVRKRGGFVE